MYNTILVPLDGSKRAEHILGHVEKLGVCDTTKVIFIQVVRPPKMLEYGTPKPELFQKQLDHKIGEAKKYLDGLTGKFKEKNIDSKAVVVFGTVVKEILYAAEREDADLIAICSHGRSGLPRLYYGSVASGVLNRADRPLLIVRSR